MHHGNAKPMSWQKVKVLTSKQNAPKERFTATGVRAGPLGGDPYKTLGEEHPNINDGLGSTLKRNP